jgi:hypothetical protein
VGYALQQLRQVKTEIRTCATLLLSQPTSSESKSVCLLGAKTHVAPEPQRDVCLALNLGRKRARRETVSAVVGEFT